MFCTVWSYILIALLSNVLSHPHGPPSSACNDMMPGHGVEPQSRASPYSVYVTKTKLHSSDTIDVTIRGATDEDTIKGFMVQAQNDGKVVGKWIVDDSNIYGQTMTCFGAADTLGHRKVEGVVPNALSFAWEAPSYEHLENNLVKFNATVMHSFDKFWVGVVSEPVYLN